MRARAAGIAPDYRILERDAQHTLIPAVHRPAYYPTSTCRPAPLPAVKRTVVGFDAHSSARRARASCRDRTRDPHRAAGGDSAHPTSEAAVLQQSGRTLSILTELRTLGVTVAFDDFGTGFTSLSSLLRFPFDKLKIDRSFLAVIDTSLSAAAIVRAIAGFGTSLGLVTTGEGRRDTAAARRTPAFGLR